MASAPVRLAHLVNPFSPPPGSEFEVVQPVTFASMLAARDRALASGKAEVTLLSAQFAEDRSVVPDGFVCTPDLERSVADFFPIGSVPRLPLIGDLVDRLLAHSKADYLIYTNIDIALQPHFYEWVADQLAGGLDALIVNRRRIPDHYGQVEELPQMYSEPGKKHPGFDCFVVQREVMKRFVLGEVCVGIPFIGILMAQNVFCHAQRYHLFTEEQVTFHIGEDVYKNRHPQLFAHNRKAFWQAVKVLWPQLDSRKWPYGDRFFLERWIRWGLHPSLPIRLGLKLDWKRWTKGSG